MATRVTEDVTDVWKIYKQDQTNQDLRNRLIERYLPLVRYNAEKVWAKLPEGVDITALVILNLPNPYATGTNTPGGTFGISVGGTVSPVVASFTYNEAVPPSTGRIPTTLIVGVPLTTAAQTIQAVWSGVRGSTVIIDSPATLTAILQ